MINKLRAMLGADPFPEPLPPISIRNQRKQRIVPQIRIAETRLITRLQAANHALSRFAKAKKRAKAISSATSRLEKPRLKTPDTGKKTESRLKGQNSKRLEGPGGFKFRA